METVHLLAIAAGFGLKDESRGPNQGGWAASSRRE